METVPDYAGEVRGYRVWALHLDGVLGSVTRYWPWEPGVNAASCVYREYDQSMVSVIAGGVMAVQVTHRHGDDVPAQSCACGFYAADDHRHPKLPVHSIGTLVGDPHVLGVVECSGGIVLHENGVFRAQKARVAAVYLPGFVSAWTRTAVQRNYPGTELFTSRRDMIRKYPPAPMLERRVRWWRRRVAATGWRWPMLLGVGLTGYSAVTATFTTAPLAVGMLCLAFTWLFFAP